ncbi:MAG: phytoene/squalene synthase family protein [Phycisphaerae bacterium]|nr:phytoene/squalene synthase family protein [Phycisphaerae bacterium]
MSGTRLDEAYAACEAVVRVQAKNFYYGLRLTPEPKRSAMYAVYAWMREADDIADEAGHSQAERFATLERFRAQTDAALTGTPTDGRPLWIALADVARRHDLVSQDFHDMLDGQLADLAGTVRCATWEELRLTCYRVASTVGLVCIRVWGYTDPKAVDCAIDRGIAFQLTNILRDIREDFANGRVYLPQDELARHGLTPESLLAWPEGNPAMATRCRAFMEFQVRRAEALYQASEPLDRLIDADCRPTLWALTEIYHRLLHRIGRDPRRAIVGERVRVPTWEKLWIGFRAKRRTFAGGRGEGSRLPAGAAAS